MAEPRRAAAPAPRLEGARFLIVEARYYDSIGADLLAGATRALKAAGATHDLVSVTGALEIPAGMAIALDAAKAVGRNYDGAVALGCVVRGETFHFEIVAGESARALMDMSVDRRLASCTMPGVSVGRPPLMRCAPASPGELRLEGCG